MIMASRTKNLNRTYYVFLGFQFSSRHFNRTDLEGVLQEAIDRAEADLQKSYPGVRVVLDNCATHVGKPLGKQIIQMVSRASAGIFEVSDANPNVYFELGLSQACRGLQPMLLFNRKAEGRVAIASDVRDLLREHYSGDRLSAKTPLIARHIRQEIEKRIALEAGNAAWSVIQRLWLLNGSKERITVVCPELPPSYRPRYSQRDSQEYVRLSKFGDLDALMEVLTLLPKIAPEREVRYLVPSELHRKDREGDLIVIGGPDFNELTEKSNRAVDLPYECKVVRGVPQYVDQTNGEKFVMEFDKHKRESMDYGLFARLPNPWNEKSTMILIEGLGTRGVLGALFAFGLHATGKRNAKAVMDRLGTSSGFAVLIPVPVADSEPAIASIEVTTLRTFRGGGSWAAS